MEKRKKPLPKLPKWLAVHVRLTDKHVDKLQKVFNEIDSDGNGYIDTNELKSALQKAGQNPTDEQCKAVLAKFAKELGADKGVLFGEFQKMVAQWDSIEWDK